MGRHHHHRHENKNKDEDGGGHESEERVGFFDTMLHFQKESAFFNVTAAVTILVLFVATYGAYVVFWANPAAKLKKEKDVKAKAKAAAAKLKKANEVTDEARRSRLQQAQAQQRQQQNENATYFSVPFYAGIFLALMFVVAMSRPPYRRHPQPKIPGPMTTPGIATI
jgi:uncharacterized membrane protein (DUF106 family)